MDHSRVPVLEAFDPQDAVLTRAAYATTGVGPVAATHGAGPHDRTRS
jgi:hypothetical protein